MRRDLIAAEDPEMEQVGSMIIEVLKQPEDDDGLNHTRNRVTDLCSAYPMHDGIDS